MTPHKSCRQSQCTEIEKLAKWALWRLCQSNMPVTPAGMTLNWQMPWALTMKTMHQVNRVWLMRRKQSWTRSWTRFLEEELTMQRKRRRFRPSYRTSGSTRRLTWWKVSLQWTKRTSLWGAVAKSEAPYPTKRLCMTRGRSTAFTSKIHFVSKSSVLRLLTCLRTS